MALFLGKFSYLIDDKGRVNIPARFREQLAKEADNTLATFKGMDGCVFVFPISTLEEFRANFSTRQYASDEDARKLDRLMADGGSTARPDAQGRIVLTDEQRKHAGLVREVVISGAWKHIEIWDPERLRAHLAEAEENGLEKLAKQVLAGAGEAS